MSCKKWFSLLVAGVVLFGALAGCGAQNKQEEQKEETQTPGGVSSITGVDMNDQFSNRDKDPSYDGGAGTISLKDGATAATNGVNVAGDTITVQKAGVYRVTGSLSNGRIVVDAPEDAKIQLVLEGASVTCSGYGALYVRQADKVFLTLEKGSENSLVSQAATTDGVEENVDAALYSKDDVTINGSGKLTVNSPGHGVAVKADFVVTDGTVVVTAEGHAIQAKKSARFAAGTLNLTAGKDGVHVENADNAEEGYLYMEGGSYTVTATGDGFSAATLVQITGGSGTLTCGGGSANAPTQQGGFGGGFGGFGGGFGGGYRNNQTTTTIDSDVSGKGIKGGTAVLLEGGTWTLDAADDGIHSNGDVTVKNGTVTIATGDDGLHADQQALVQGGTLTVTKSYEGIEGNTVEIAGGTITITASDDGLNAAGGNDQSGFGGGYGGGRPDQFMETDGSSYIRLSGGKLVMDASGDGIDSNGDLYIEGGETYVSGPTNSGNGALDYGGSAKVTGGILCAAGASGMAQGFTEAANQGGMFVTVSNMAGGDVVLTDSTGKELFRWTPSKNYNAVALTCPGILQGQTYTLALAGVTETVQMTEWIYGKSGGFGGGGFGGGTGGRPGRPGESGGFERPEGGFEGMPSRPEGGFDDMPDMPEDGFEGMPSFPGEGFGGGQGGGFGGGTGSTGSL